MMMMMMMKLWKAIYNYYLWWWYGVCPEHKVLARKNHGKYEDKWTCGDCATASGFKHAQIVAFKHNKSLEKRTAAIGRIITVICLVLGMIGHSHAQTHVPHSVTLSWKSSAGATQYKVWRVQSDPSKPMSLLGTTTGLVFTDGPTGVTTCATYYYAVSALDSAGGESLMSNVVRAVIETKSDPCPPDSPTNLKGSAK